MKIELGKIYVSEVDTSAGHHVRFWIGLAGNTVTELQPISNQIDKITWNVKPSPYVLSDIVWKAKYSSVNGLHIGENGNKKSIALTRLAEYDDSKEYVNIFDASKLK